MKQGVLPVLIGAGVAGGLAGATWGAFAPPDVIGGKECGFLSSPTSAEGIARCELIFWGLTLGGTVLGGLIGWYAAEKM